MFMQQFKVIGVFRVKYDISAMRPWTIKPTSQTKQITSSLLIEAQRNKRASSYKTLSAL